MVTLSGFKGDGWVTKGWRGRGMFPEHGLKEGEGITDLPKTPCFLVLLKRTKGLLTPALYVRSIEKKVYIFQCRVLYLPNDLGEKMGGHGSGTWCRWSTKTTTEDCKKIDIRFMKRSNLLVPGGAGALSWTCNGEPSGDIRFRYHEGRLVLSYRYRVNGGEWEPVEQSIPVTTTPCNYGNERQWFLCPRCHYRCAILYSGSNHFLCRKCYNLPYRSQMQGYSDRIFDQKHSLGERIFQHYDHGEGWLKKKGMHQKTFDNLYSKYQQLESTIDQLTILRFGQLL